MMKLFTETCSITPLAPAFNLPIVIDVLRLDEVDPVVSGNKWFKLKYYLNEAASLKKRGLLTFGGPYSNHLVATARAAQLCGLKSTGVVRGEAPATLSPTLATAIHFGMRLYFSSREAYQQKKIPTAVFDDNNQEEWYIIPEGGYGELGRQGACDILLQNSISGYTHIISAVGTGTTLAGLAAAATGQKVIGISVLKSNFSIRHEVQTLLPPGKQNNFDIIHDYHFGGYAKHTPQLITFMNFFYENCGIATDFVYTAKAFYGVFDLVEKKYFDKNDRVLLLHTGGLQGNNSLKKGTLIWDV